MEPPPTVTYADIYRPGVTAEEFMTLWAQFERHEFRRLMGYDMPQIELAPATERAPGHGNAANAG